MNKDQTIYICSRCSKEVSKHQAERIGLKVYCSECADEFFIDSNIRQLVAVPGRT